MTVGTSDANAVVGFNRESEDRCDASGSPIFDLPSDGGADCASN
jgi:hypothetical protein